MQACKAGPRWGVKNQLALVSLALLSLWGGLLAALPASAVEAAAPLDVAYWSSTGHYTSGAFKTYWERNGGLEQYGYPISEPFLQRSPTEIGKFYVTQYFERAVFEYHPENVGSKYAVLLGLLGRTLTAGRDSQPAFGPIAAFPNDRDRLYFPETGHSLAFGFRGYWERSGGLPQFGYPISEEFQELNPADGKTYTVQYFERGRFEYHPELRGTRYEVLLGLLGRQQADALNVRADVRAFQSRGKEASLSGPGANGVPKVQPGFDGPAFPLKSAHLGYGMNVWLFGMDKERVLGLVRGAGFSWVRQQLSWESFEPVPGQYQWDELDRTVDAAVRNNVHLILSVVRSPKWAGINGTTGLPANPATYGELMRRLAERYRGRVEGYEVWNEQNIERETGGGKVQVGPYIETLKAAYRGVKAADPWAAVIFGGLSPTGINDPGYAVDDAVFLEQCYQYNGGEMRNYFDVLGAHPGSAANSPDEFWPIDKPTDPNRPWTTHPSFYFRRIENLRSLMEKYGDGAKQVWLTEFGWTTKNEAPGYEYGALVSEESQAQYLVRAFQRAKTAYPWMGVMSVWQLNFAPIVGPQDEKGPWGLLRADWSTRPSYDALKLMPK